MATTQAQETKLQNIAIPETIHRVVKARAAELGVSIRELTIEALELKLGVKLRPDEQQTEEAA